MEEKTSAPRRPNSQMVAVVERNIRTLIDRRQREENQQNVEQRMADRITRFTGSLPFVYLHLCLFGNDS
jgi:uncharacterized membrane protein